MRSTDRVDTQAPQRDQRDITLRRPVPTNEFTHGDDHRVDQLSTLAVTFLQCALQAFEPKYFSAPLSGVHHPAAVKNNVVAGLNYDFLSNIVRRQPSAKGGPCPSTFGDGIARTVQCRRMAGVGDT